MYQVEAFSAVANALRGSGSRWGWLRVGRNVLALGFTSLLTDVSSEMVATVLPVYLVLHLGLTPLHFAVVDGLYNGATALLRMIGGVVADRARRDKEVAAVGYAISTACKIGLVLAGGSWPLIAGTVALDRAAKGLRTAPRDALISLSSNPADLGASFGVHRSLDSVGAMLGPLVALMILAVLPGAYDVVFVTSFSIGILGLGVLLFFVENKEGRVDRGIHRGQNAAGIRTLFEASGFRTFVAVAVVLSVVTVSDGFLYLILQQNARFRAGLVPLLYVVTAASFLVLAIPMGWIADRFGRRWTFLGGYAVLACAYLAAQGGDRGVWGIGLCVLSLGCYYAMTDGVLMALASASLPAEILGTGLAFLTTLTSIGRLVGSLAFGALWTVYGARVAVGSFFITLVGGVLVGALLLTRRAAEDEHQIASS